MRENSHSYAKAEPYLYIIEDPNGTKELQRQCRTDGYRVCTLTAQQDAAEQIGAAAICLAWITPEFADSQECRTELKLALAQKKTIISLIAKGVHLPLSLRLQVNETRKIELDRFDSLEALCQMLYLEPEVVLCQRSDSAQNVQKEECAEETEISEEQEAAQKEIHIPVEMDNEEAAPNDIPDETDAQDATRYAVEISEDTDSENHAPAEVWQEDLPEEYRTCYAEEILEPNAPGSEEPQRLEPEMEPPKIRGILLQPLAGIYHPLRAGRTRLGRTAEHCDLVIPYNKLLSRHHADIQKQETGWFLQDVGSSNGTMLDGVLLQQGEGKELQNQAEILLADEQLLFVCEDLAEQILGGAAIPVLVCMETGERRGIGRNGLQLGRAHRWFANRMNDPKISRNHAEVFWNSDGCYLHDLQSTNGTFRNGKKLMSGEQIRLYPGDQIQLGKLTLQCMELSLQAGTQ